MRTMIGSLAAFALVFGAATAASAQGMGRGPVAQACATEIGRFCGQLSHGGGQVRNCLQSHADDVSPGCRSALDHTGYGRRWR